MNQNYSIKINDQEILTFREFTVPNKAIVHTGQWRHPKTQEPITISWARGLTKPADPRTPTNALEFMWAYIEKSSDLHHLIKKKAQADILKLFEFSAIYRTRALQQQYPSLATTADNLGQKYLVDDLKLFSSVKSVEEKLKSYIKGLELYDNYMKDCETLIANICQNTGIVPATLFANTRRGEVVNLKSVRKLLRNEIVEKNKEEYPQTLEELREFINPCLQEHSNASINEDFKVLFNKKVLPLLGDMYVPFGIHPIFNTNGEPQMSRCFLYSYKDTLENNWNAQIFYDQGLENEPLFLSEESVKKYLMLTQNEDEYSLQANAYFYLKNGKIADVRYSNEELFAKDMGELLILIEKDSLLQTIEENVNPNSQAKNKTSIKI